MPAYQFEPGMSRRPLIFLFFSGWYNEENEHVNAILRGSLNMVVAMLKMKARIPITSQGGGDPTGSDDYSKALQELAEPWGRSEVGGYHANPQHTALNMVHASSDLRCLPFITFILVAIARPKARLSFEKNGPSGG